MTRARLRLDAGELNGALDDLTAAIERDARSAGILQAYPLRARIYRELGEDAKAIEDQDRAAGFMEESAAPPAVKRAV